MVCVGYRVGTSVIPVSKVNIHVFGMIAEILYFQKNWEVKYFRKLKVFRN